MANLPSKKPEIKSPPKPTYAPDAPVLEQARQALREGITPADALAMAATLPEKPERADAAFFFWNMPRRVEMPRRQWPWESIMTPASICPAVAFVRIQPHAFEWYQIALEGGHTESRNRLTDLRRWVVASAENGAADAQALLETWP
jgi:hypothetical protein